MRQDVQTYRRATQAALLGFLAQVVLLVVMLLTAFWASSENLIGESVSLFAIAHHMVGGLLVWVILWMVYNQHRLERLESIETEQMSKSDAQMAALFDEHAEELQVSRKRLRGLYKYGINGVSLAVAAYLLSIGFYYAWRSWSFVQNPFTWTPAELGAEHSTTLLVLTIVMAFFAFVSARYIAGMTKVKEWEMLRGGAGYLMATAIMSVVSFAAALSNSFDRPGMWSYLTLIFSLILIITGVEIVMSFLMGAYRPRKPGEMPKPPFESRLLGWLTAPESIAKIVNETINYQFGFEVSKSWFYRLLGKAITPLIAFGILTLLGISSIIVVAPHEQAIITRMGHMSEPVGPGIHFKLPWPFGRAEKYPVRRIHQLVVGSSTELPEEGKAILWTNQHSGNEEWLITAPTPYEGRIGAAPVDGDEEESGPAGMSLAGAQIIIQYTVEDLAKFVQNAPFPYYMLSATNPQIRQHANRMLSSIAERRVNAYFATHTIDEMLGASAGDEGADDASSELREQIDADFDTFGLKVLMVSLSGVHPPQEQVAPSFLELIGVKQERETTIEKAKAAAIKQLAQVAGSKEMADKIHDAILRLEQLKDDIAALPKEGDGVAEQLAAKEKQRIAQEVEVERLLTQSRGQAADEILDARAERWARAIDEHTQAIIFAAEAKAYRNAPEYYLLRRYLEAQEEALKDARAYVLSGDPKDKPIIRLKLPDPSGKLQDWLTQEPTN